MLAGPSPAVSGSTNAKPRGLVETRPDDKVHPVREAEPVPADLDQLPGLDERPQLALERGALVARNPQELQQLPHRRGMIDSVPDGC